jgi:organic radical activating enzyme
MFNFIDIYSFIRVSGCVGRGPGCDSIVAGFTTTYAHSWRGVLDTTLCDKVCQLLATSH